MNTQELCSLLIDYSMRKNINYTLRGNPISLPEIFSITGLLPAIAKRADHIASLCFGKGIGVDFIQQEKTTLGYSMSLDSNAPPFIILITIIDILEEITKNAPQPQRVALDELLYD